MIDRQELADRGTERLYRQPSSPRLPEGMGNQQRCEVIHPVPTVNGCLKSTI